MILICGKVTVEPTTLTGLLSVPRGLWACSAVVSVPLSMPRVTLHHLRHDTQESLGMSLGAETQPGPSHLTPAITVEAYIFQRLPGCSAAATESQQILMLRKSRNSTV